jgi:DtxR family transcriptional regulator, Mn-dependent transcriptional regulator
MYTSAVEDYLKVVYELLREDGRATTTAIADRLGVAPASVSGMFKKLVEMRLIEHTPYQGVVLTESGEKIALEVIRHHRLVELYLAEALGVPWDEVHAEAHRLEHAISPAIAERMAAALGYPDTDPHGAPIPTREGAIAAVATRRLSDLHVGDSGAIAEVIDEDAGVLRSLAAMGLFPNAMVEVVTRSTEGGMVVRVGATDHAIDTEAATRVFIQPMAS